LFATPAIFQGDRSLQAEQFGVFSAFVALVLLTAALVIAYRYGKIGKRVENKDPAMRPKKSDTLNLIRVGLVLNLVGMMFAIVGAQALVGISLAKLLTLAPQLIGPNPEQFVNSLDMLIIQANTNTIGAHFAGIATSLFFFSIASVIRSIPESLKYVGL